MTGIKMIFEDLVDCDPIDDYLEAALARESWIHQECLGLAINCHYCKYSNIDISTYIHIKDVQGRVAEVGSLSCTAKNPTKPSVERAFANFRDKKRVFANFCSACHYTQCSDFLL